VHGETVSYELSEAPFGLLPLRASGLLGGGVFGLGGFPDGGALGVAQAEVAECVESAGDDGGAGVMVVFELPGADGFSGLFQVGELDEFRSGLAPEEDDAARAGCDPRVAVDVVDGSRFGAVLAFALVVEYSDVDVCGVAELNRPIDVASDLVVGEFHCCVFQRVDDDDVAVVFTREFDEEMGLLGEVSREGSGTYDEAFCENGTVGFGKSASHGAADLSGPVHREVEDTASGCDGESEEIALKSEQAAGELDRDGGLSDARRSDE
jgi:hypothetical protein